MNRKTIYVDFDDCLCETARDFLCLLKTHFGKTVRFDDIHSFDLDHAFGLSTAEHERLMSLGHENEFLEALPPVPGAAAALEAWRQQGYAICIATGRPTMSNAVSRSWLERHRIPYDELIFVDKYGRRMGPPDAPPSVTLDALSRRQFALAVEDAPVMIDYLHQHMTLPVVVFARPWNHQYPMADRPGANGIARCRDWQHILDVFPRP